jgi:predicted enzyme related to lactoylglutathione lyase
MTRLPEPQPLGAPVWVDLASPDVEASRAFYSELLGWTFTEPAPEFGGYVRARSADGDVAGVGPVMEGGFPAWTLYFRTASNEAAAAAITGSGGTVVVPPMAVGPLGSMLVAQDPTGAFFGLWENGEMTGFEQYGCVGAMAWCDLRSPDPDAARAFYGPLLGWSYTAMELAGPAYTTVTLDGSDDPVAGVGDFMGVEGIPPHWDVYFVCPDADAGVETVKRLGGQAFAPPFDTPYGRMCPVADPAGATFWLMSEPAA